MLTTFLFSAFLGLIRVMIFSLYLLIFSAFFEVSIVSLPSPQSALKWMHVPRHSSKYQASVTTFSLRHDKTLILN